MGDVVLVLPCEHSEREGVPVWCRPSHRTRKCELLMDDIAQPILLACHGAGGREGIPAGVYG